VTRVTALPAQGMMRDDGRDDGRTTGLMTARDMLAQSRQS
jgi:hypothetical protein